MQMIFAIFITLFILSLASLISYTAISNVDNFDVLIEEARNNITSILLAAFILFIFIMINVN